MSVGSEIANLDVQRKSFEVNVVEMHSEQEYGEFPAQALKTDGVIDVVFEKATFEQLASTYCEGAFTKDMLRRVYIEAGIVQAIVRDELRPNDYEHIEGIYRALSSPDSLARAVLEAKEVEDAITEEQERTLLLAIKEGWIVTDYAQINAARLSLALVREMNEDEGVATDYAMEETMRDHLREYLSGWEPYRKTRQAFRASTETTAQQFANNIPLIEIIGAFPMQRYETEQFLHTIIANSHED